MPADTPAKPKPTKLGAEKLTPEEQRVQALVDEARSTLAHAKLVARSARIRADKAAAEVRSSEAQLSKAVGKLGTEKLTPEEQRRRVIEAGREAGASEDEAAFDVALKRFAMAKPVAT